MNIGFDAKRAYHNTTGLGNYSRILIKSLVTFFPQHHYFLFNPKQSSFFDTAAYPNTTEVLPPSAISRFFPSMWRSSWVKADLKKKGIGVYHGLSHEIPGGIQHTSIRSVVTMHDLIFEMFPDQFSAVDVRVFRAKFRYACRHADKIIAISQQTKKDLIRLYEVPGEKIEVCYQSCDPRFEILVSESEREMVRAKYHLPAEYFLYTGSIIKRKNLLTVCKAYQCLPNDMKIPLVIIGDGKQYKNEVKSYIQQHRLTDLFIFLADRPAVASDEGYRTSSSFPAIYQMAKALIYPSVYEGFGLPVLEALWSNLPVITSSVSCLPEAGGPGAFYVDPASSQQIAEAMMEINGKTAALEGRIRAGIEHARQFTTDKTAAAVMDVYESLYE